jgi:hypothetical protein
MKNILKDGIDNVSSELLEKANRNVERILTAVADAKNELEEAKRKANVTEKYWDKVEAARKFFEVSSVFARQYTESLKLSIHLLPALLYHVHCMERQPQD